MQDTVQLYHTRKGTEQSLLLPTACLFTSLSWSPEEQGHCSNADLTMHPSGYHHVSPSHVMPVNLQPNINPASESPADHQSNEPPFKDQSNEPLVDCISNDSLADH